LPSRHLLSLFFILIIINKNINPVKTGRKKVVMENNKNNSDWLYSFFTFLTLLFLFFGYLFFSSEYHKRNNDPFGVRNYVERIKSEPSLWQQKREVLEFVAKNKNKFTVLSMNSFDYTNKIIYYQKDGYMNLVPEELYGTDIKGKENDVLKFLSDKQEDFDQESKVVFEEFQQGDAKSKVDLLSTERGKAHLIYRYNGNPGYERWLNGDYLVLKIYYNPNSESDINNLATSLDILRKQAKDKGNILRLNLIDVNKENAVVLEDINYSGDVTAVAYPIRVTAEYGMFENKENRHQISLTKNPDHIIDLVDYFNKSNFEEFIQNNVIPKNED
jgi:hypothetical protein